MLLYLVLPLKQLLKRKLKKNDELQSFLAADVITGKYREIPKPFFEEGGFNCCGNLRTPSSKKGFVNS